MLANLTEMTSCERCTTAGLIYLLYDVMKYRAIFTTDRNLFEKTSIDDDSKLCTVDGLGTFWQLPDYCYSNGN